MKNYILFVSILYFNYTFAQFEIPAPLPFSGTYTITDTVYMDVYGSDTGTGSFNSPVKSFSVAVNKLPYGTPGVNGGNAYGLILLKPGTYYTATGFQQYANQWQNGNTYKNVSVEGIGDVTISGKIDSFATSSLIYLSGSHVYIRNLKLRYSDAHGVLISGNNRQTNIVIDGVEVDSVRGFCMLFKNTDTILVSNSKGLYGARPGSDSLVSPCQWPSGIKFLGCRYVTIHHSEIAYSRGEGLNFHNTSYGLAYNNLLHDNGLNMYDDNSSHLIIRNNLVYNTPGIDKRYWTNCPASPGNGWSGTGIMLANEGACIQGNAPSFTGCQLNCILPDESFNTVDSVFVYNNLFQNTGSAFSFWEGSTQINGVNCIRNVFMFNNTVVGLSGDSLSNSIGVVNFYFPSYNAIFNSYYSTLSNVKIENNIFAYDTGAHANLAPVRKVFNPLHPGPLDISFRNNLWIQGHSSLGTGDLVRNSLPFSVPMLKDSTFAITPCDSNVHFAYDVPVPFAFVKDDYHYLPRRSPLSNAGAIELDSFCLLNTALQSPAAADNFRVFPNPFESSFNIELNLAQNGYNHNNANLEITDATGKVLLQQAIRHASVAVQLSAFSPGVYFLKLSTGNSFTAKRIVKQ